MANNVDPEGIVLTRLSLLGSMWMGSGWASNSVVGLVGG
jgi:hypothetical protein